MPVRLRPIRVLLAAMAVFVLRTPLASADAPWTEPRALGEPEQIEGFSLEPAPEGKMFVAVRAVRGRRGRLPGAVRVWQFAPNTSDVRPFPVPDDLILPPVLDASSSCEAPRLVLVRARRAGRRTRLSVSFASLSGRVRQTRQLGVFASPTDRRAALPRVAVSSYGAVAVAWFELGRAHPGGRLLRLRVAQADLCQRFKPPVTVARTRLRRPERADQAVALAYGYHSLVVAYGVRRNVVEARVRTGNRPFRSRVSLGRRDDTLSLTAAGTWRNNGRVVVAWGGQAEANAPWTIRAAIRSGAPARFSSPIVLDRADALGKPPGRLAASVAWDGAATVAWSGLERAADELRAPVRVASTAPRPRGWIKSQLAPNGILGDIAQLDIEPTSTTLAAFAKLDDDPRRDRAGRIFAAVAFRSHAVPLESPASWPAPTFAAPEVISAPSRFLRASLGPTAAFAGFPVRHVRDPVTGESRPTSDAGVLWGSHLTDSDPGSELLQLSFRRSSPGSDPVD